MRTLAVVAFLFAPIVAWPQEITGRVVDSATGRGIAHAEVWTTNDYEWTDSMGAFAIKSSSYGRNDVAAKRNDYLERHRTVDIRVGIIGTATIVLHRAPPPCCALAGEWEVRLVLDSAGALVKQRPTARQVTGRMIFGPKIPAPYPPQPLPDDAIVEESGRNYVDVSPFFGGPVAPQVSTTIKRGEGPLLQEVVGSVAGGDLVDINTIPRVSHGGLALSGRIHGDSLIAGRWYERAYCCGATGHFTMRRVSHETPEVHDPLPPPPDSQGGAGRVRVRVWDESVGRYIVAFYGWRLSDGTRDFGILTADTRDGRGLEEVMLPGNYCGEKDWERTDVTVRVGEPCRN